MNARVLTPIGALLALTLPASAAAAERQGLALGPPGLRLEAALGSEGRYTDNLYRTARDEESAFGAFLLPELTLRYERPTSELQLGYRGEAGAWDSREDDDYLDTEAFAAAGWQLLPRHHIELDGGYELRHDARGTKRTQGPNAFIEDDLDRWHAYEASGEYTYGRRGARLNLSLRGGFRAIRYLNNRDATTNPDTGALAQGTRFLDRSRLHVGGRAVYALGSRSGLVLDAEHSEIRYPHDLVVPLDGSLTRVLTGLQWRATARTRGDVLIGYFRRDFDDSRRGDADGFDWRVALHWNPVTETTLRLDLGREINEMALQGEDLLDRRFVAASWEQDWTQRLSSQLGVMVARDDFEGASRDDDLIQGELELAYAISKRWSASAGVQYGARDSSTSAFDYDALLARLGLEVRL